jgi:hypothetical protein
MGIDEGGCGVKGKVGGGCAVPQVKPKHCALEVKAADKMGGSRGGGDGGGGNCRGRGRHCGWWRSEGGYV